MAKQNDSPFPRELPRWLEPVVHSLARGRRSEALARIDQIIEEDYPLFWGDPSVDKGRRLAWVFRIHLLMDWKKYSDALAWACLECDFNPGNVAVLAMKERLMRGLRLGPGSGESVVTFEPLGMGPWQGVHGMRLVRSRLEDEVIGPFSEPETYRRYQLTIPSGVLLHGPPGCGKTHIARALAGKIGARFYEVTPAELSTPYVHGGKEKIATAFRVAADNAPAVLFLDEFDAVAPRRSRADLAHTYAAEVDELLSQLSKAAERRVLVVAATNRREAIDEAVLRPGRFDVQIEIGPPDLEARASFLRAELKRRPAAPKIDVMPFVHATDGVTFAELKRIVDVAALKALKARRPITADDLSDSWRSQARS